MRACAEEQVAAQAIAVDPSRWRSYASHEVELLIRNFGAWDPVTGKVSRSALWDLARRARGAEGQERSKLADALLWSSLAWGQGKTYRLARKRSFALLGAPAGLAVRLFDQAQLPASAEELFNSLHWPSSPARVKYWGPNFYTKFFYFAAPRTAPAAHLIVDQQVRQTLAALKDPRVGKIHAAPGGFGWHSYNASVRLMNLLSQEWGVRPDDVEFAAFGLGRPKPSVDRAARPSDVGH